MKQNPPEPLTVEAVKALIGFSSETGNPVFNTRTLPASIRLHATANISQAASPEEEAIVKKLANLLVAKLYQRASDDFRNTLLEVTRD